MNKFILKNLTFDELLLFYNCIREATEAFDCEDQFSTRIGVNLNQAQEVMIELRNEKRSRPESEL